MVSLGLLTKNQFHGVESWYKEANVLNRANHPEAHWYDEAWEDVLLNHENFNPGLIYFDSEFTVESKEAARMTAATMRRCPYGTVLIVNVMLTNPYKGVVLQDTQVLLDNIAQHFTDTELEAWDWFGEGFDSYTYSGSGRTVMLSLTLFKQEAPNDHSTQSTESREACETEGRTSSCVL
jgi:hypothetical protein